MSTRLKYVDPSRRPGSFSRAYAAFSNTRLGRFISVNVVWKVDPYADAGNPGPRRDWLSSSPPPCSKPGARRAARLRRNVVIYFHDGDRVTIVASKLGHAKHPAWFHNLRAHPDVTFGGIPMRATVVERRGRAPTALGARRPGLRALRGVPARGGEGEPDDPDRPAQRPLAGDRCASATCCGSPEAGIVLESSSITWLDRPIPSPRTLPSAVGDRG